jgi:protein SERAC1
LEHLHSIFVSTYGILFLGTPHEGSNKAKMAATSRRMVDAVVPRKVISTTPQLLESLHEQSDVLKDITCNFTPLLKEFEIYFFWEQLPTSLPHSNDYV